jgi:hypothetical protein
MKPKQAFMDYAREQGWRFDLVSLHEAHVNSNKLPAPVRYQPSFLVDTDFHDLSKPIIMVEVKSTKLGEVKILKEEFQVHREFNSRWGVYYAIYNPSTKVIQEMIALSSIDGNLTEDEKYFVFNIDEMSES